MKNPILLLFSLIVLSCNNKTEFKTIVLPDVSNIGQNFNFLSDSIVASTEIITLQSGDSCIIGSKPLLCESKEFYFIVSDNRLYQFDKSGKYIRQIGCEGRGPQEYLYIKDIDIDEINKCLYILDYNSQKVLKFSFYGFFITSFDFNLPKLSYVSSLFLYHNTVILGVPNNSLKMELYSYNESNRALKVISMKERDMVAGEGILGRSFNFGSQVEPLLYNYFNDTVYKLKDFKLEPEFVLSSGNYKYTFNELANLGRSIEDKKMQIVDIVSGGRYIFIFYSVTKLNGKRFSSFLAIYDRKTGSFHQNACIENQQKYLSVKPGDNIFPGFEDDCIILLRYPAEILDSDSDYDIREDNNPILIKFKLI